MKILRGWDEDGVIDIALTISDSFKSVVDDIHFFMLKLFIGFSHGVGLMQNLVLTLKP